MLREKDNPKFDDLLLEAVGYNDQKLNGDESALKRATGKEEVNLEDFSLTAAEKQVVIDKCAKYPDFKEMKNALEETRQKYSRVAV